MDASKFSGLMNRFESYLDSIENPQDSKALLDRFESLVVRLEKVSAAGG